MLYLAYLVVVGCRTAIYEKLQGPGAALTSRGTSRAEERRKGWESIEVGEGVEGVAEEAREQ